VGSSGSWFAQLMTFNLLVWGLKPSQPHPEPWTPIEAAANCFLNSSNEPKSWARAFSKSPKKQTNTCHKSLQMLTNTIIDYYRLLNI